MLSVENVLETKFSILKPDQTLGDFVDIISKSNRNIFPVVDDDNNFLGMVTLDDVREIMFDKNKYDSIKVHSLMNKPKSLVHMDDNMDKVMKKFKESGWWNLPVVENDKYRGFVSRSNVFNLYRKMLIEFSEE